MNTSSFQLWVEVLATVGFDAESHGIAFDTAKLLATRAAGELELDIAAGECSHEARFLRGGVSIRMWSA
jgi:hypothetical protein